MADTLGDAAFPIDSSVGSAASPDPNSLDNTINAINQNALTWWSALKAPTLTPDQEVALINAQTRQQIALASPTTSALAPVLLWALIGIVVLVLVLKE